MQEQSEVTERTSIRVSASFNSLGPIADIAVIVSPYAEMGIYIWGV